MAITPTKAPAVTVKLPSGLKAVTRNEGDRTIVDVVEAFDGGLVSRLVCEAVLRDSKPEGRRWIDTGSRPVSPPLPESEGR